MNKFFAGIELEIETDDAAEAERMVKRLCEICKEYEGINDAWPGEVEEDERD